MGHRARRNIVLHVRRRRGFVDDVLIVPASVTVAVEICARVMLRRYLVHAAVLIKSWLLLYERLISVAGLLLIGHWRELDEGTVVPFVLESRGERIEVGEIGGLTLIFYGTFSL